MACPPELPDPQRSRRSARPGRLAWLLWLLGLALLLPAAQSAAARHALSHLGRGALVDDGHGKAPGPTHCDLCLAGAALGHAGLAASPPAPALPEAQHARPLAALCSLWLAALALAYRSRAPPQTPR